MMKRKLKYSLSAKKVVDAISTLLLGGGGVLGLTFVVYLFVK